MSKKHFEILARNLKEIKPHPEDFDRGQIDPQYAEVLNQWSKDVRAVADACLAGSERFDYRRFLEAAGAALHVGGVRDGAQM